MRKILDEIQTGQFAQEWILENQAGRPVFNALRKKSAEHPIEEVGDRAAVDDAVDRAGQGQAPGRLRRLSTRASVAVPPRVLTGCEVIVVGALLGYVIGMFPSADLVARFASRGRAVDLRAAG